MVTLGNNWEYVHQSCSACAVTTLNCPKPLGCGYHHAAPDDERSPLRGMQCSKCKTALGMINPKP
jgi:hypothetical protein